MVLATVNYSFSSLKVLEVPRDIKKCSPLVRDGITFKIHFIHSVELTRWVEIFEIKGRMLHLKTLTNSAGWALPSTATLGNFSFKEVVMGEDGWHTTLTESSTRSRW